MREGLMEMIQVGSIFQFIGWLLAVFILPLTNLPLIAQERTLQVLLQSENLAELADEALRFGDPNR